ncbi:MAG: Membrane protease subunit [Acidobacteriales bacterium]|nr:Membrane protease subunit [Terriglobales bacterium]
MTNFGGKIIDEHSASAGKLVSMAIVAGIVVIFLFMSVTMIGPGEVGVITLFGRVTDEVLYSGIHLVNPLKRVHEMSVRTQSLKESASVPSSEGLVINLDTSLVFHLRSEQAAGIFREIGPRYVEVIIEPTLRSAIREATASHSANTLYSSGREQVASQIKESLRQELGRRGIEVEQILLRDIQLPATLRASIEAKQQAEQESLAMSFKLQKEKQEADRKRIEAQGIRDFQQTVSQGISQQLLEWKGIEATENLAKSPNTKIVVIGNTKNGLPLIMGQ